MQLAHEKNQHQETNKLKPFNGDVSSPLFAPETNAVGFLITAAISSCQKIQWNCSFSGIFRTYFLFWSCFFSCCVWLLFVRQYIDRQMMSLLLLCGKPSHWGKCVTEAGIHILPYQIHDIAIHRFSLLFSLSCECVALHAYKTLLASNSCVYSITFLIQVGIVYLFVFYPSSNSWYIYIYKTKKAICVGRSVAIDVYPCFELVFTTLIYLFRCKLGKNWWPFPI